MYIFLLEDRPELSISNWFTYLTKTQGLFKKIDLILGCTGGLQDPLTAIIKNTKLRLGAAK